MAKKGFKKQKAASQKSKQRKPKPQGAGGGGSSSSSPSSSSGTMSGFRRGLQIIAGTGKKKGPKTPVEKVFDIILWLAVIAAGFYFVSKQCT